MLDPRESERLLVLLNERSRSHFDLRKRRMESVPMDSVISGLRKEWAGDGEPLTQQEFVGTHCGFLPDEDADAICAQEMEKVNERNRLRLLKKQEQALQIAERED